MFLLFFDLYGKFGKINCCWFGGCWVWMVGGGVKFVVE